MEPDGLLPISMLNALAYCQRRFFLEHVEGVFVRNAYVEDGRQRHDRMAKGRADKSLKEDGRLKTRSLSLSSEGLGITGVIDVLEEDGEGSFPVEYKRGKKPPAFSGPWPVWENDAVQLCAQGLLLEENSDKEISHGFMYYMGSRDRLQVAFDGALRGRTREYIALAQNLMSEKSSIPPPLADDRRCGGCSLRPVCLPEETRYLKGEGGGSVEYVFPYMDEGAALYVQDQGAVVKKSGEHLIVGMKAQDAKATVPIPNLRQVVVFGNVQVTTQALDALMDEGVPVVYLSTYGRYKGMLLPYSRTGLSLRLSQFTAVNDPVLSLAVSKEIVSAKISNCRVLLMRYARKGGAGEDETGPTADAIASLDNLKDKALSAENAEELLGTEGMAARIYFEEMASIVKGHDFDFSGRNRRPPRDPVNALLSFGYMLLLKDVISAVAAVGFEPNLGFYHGVRRNRPSLALDLMEEFRPVIADSVVLTMINKGMVDNKDFMRYGSACYLNEDGRKKFFQAYEDRKNTEVQHPVFGYKISYTRTLEVQARMLAAYIRGELPEYKGFRIR